MINVEKLEKKLIHKKDGEKIQMPTYFLLRKKYFLFIYQI